MCLIIARIQRSLSCDNSTSNHKKMVNQTMFCTLYKSLDALKLHTCNSHSNWNRISHLGITWNGTPHLVGMECHTWEWLGKLRRRDRWLLEWRNIMEEFPFYRCRCAWPLGVCLMEKIPCWWAFQLYDMWV